MMRLQIEEWIFIGVTAVGLSLFVFAVERDDPERPVPHARPAPVMNLRTPATNSEDEDLATPGQYATDHPDSSPSQSR